MNRTYSTPTNSRVPGKGEELKELFTDPAFRKKKIGADKKSNKVSNNLNESYIRTDAEATAPEIKITNSAINVASNHLLIRRISIAGSFLDIALFSANCEQLKFVLELGYFFPYYYHVLGLLITSLVLQLLVGVTMFLLGCDVVHKSGDVVYSNILNHITMGLVALITIVNIFISTFAPKGSVMARCLGLLAYANVSGPVFSYLNMTSNFTTAAFTH